MKKVTPFLWFDTQAEEAANFYVSLFRNAKVTHVSPGPNNRAMTVNFELDGQEFVALNGGPMHKFSEATSFVITCADQPEIDHFWNALTADGGQESQCGWLKDKYGLSWQVVPHGLGQLLRSPGAVQAMMKMKKLDIAKLQAAA